MSHKETHKGYEIVIEDDVTAAGDQQIENLKIDNKQIDVSELEPGRYSTSYLPYTTYNSIIDLAKEVIDHTADFDTLSGQ